MKKRQRKDTIDIKNKKFFRLMVLEKAESIGKRGAFWKCICDCGNKCTVYGGHLRSGDRKSCGCIAEDNIDRTGVDIVFRMYKSRAKRRKKQWELTREEFVKFLTKNCIYCGSPPKNLIRRAKSKKIQIAYTGIDRKDPNIGYVLENCVPCCRYCNQSKSNLMENEWIDHLKKIFEHLRFNK